MNAKPAGDKAEALLDDPMYIAEIKYDGYRAICDNGRFTSRLGNDFSEKLPHLTGILKEFNVTLDGELYIPGGNSSDVTTALGSDGDRTKLKYVVFDILATDAQTLTGATWSYRREILDKFFMFNIEGTPEIDISNVYKNKRELLKYAETHGLEGIMLKNINGLYCPDKRPSNNWWKIKKHLTFDVVMMGVTEGKGKYSGLIGAIKFGLYVRGTLVECGQCSGMTDEIRKEISEDREAFLYTVFEIGAMERTKDGNFRHPVYQGFRNDKSQLQCTWEQ
jgi:ATP-dependent DNA ligase